MTGHPGWRVSSARVGAQGAPVPGHSLRTVKPFKPKLTGWALAVWGVGGFVIAVAAILWIVDFHRYGMAVPLLVLTAVGLNLLSMAISRRDRTF
jgi:hypothetical protein